MQENYLQQLYDVLSGETLDPDIKILCFMYCHYGESELWRDIAITRVGHT